jgi:tRNA (cytidine/uridine-2'-O-)-methyltransferase|tara:strand:+ start:202 stop:687 length:486 start_codon:yes stop_codon:yes gene_type:complete
MHNEKKIHIVLWQPKIPQNTGNIIRLCANTGAELHLIHPLGFNLKSSKLKRASLDYSDLTIVREHGSFLEYTDSFPKRRLLGTTSSSNNIYSSIKYTQNDSLIFGSEDTGLPDEILSFLTVEKLLRIPMRANNRSLNLSNAVSIVLYEAWKQSNFNGSKST